MSLTEQSVIALTGAGSGIGRALAIALARESISGIAISDIDEERLVETENLVKTLGVKVFSTVVDVANRADVQLFADQTIEKLGSVTHLINNAGVGMVGRTEELSFEDIEWMMGINFWGTVYGTKIFLPIFRKQDFGHIVNMSSVFGFISPPGQSAYCASKFAVRGFTEVLRHELDGSGIFVSCVYPGGIQTNIAKDARKGEKASEADKKIAPIILEKLAPSTAEHAALTIIRGVKAKDPRILIGNDARRISAIQRLFPKRYFKIMDRLSGGLLSKYK